MEIVATGFGGPDRLAARETRTAAPGKGEVAVRIMAAAVNPVDRKLYADPDYTRSHGEAAPEFPLRLGVEAAGVVTAVGEVANGPAGPILVGDEVIAYRIRGAYADQVVVPAQSILPKPPQLSWAQAGSMMLVGTAAAHALAAVRARPGDTVLLHGAGGGVGASVLQLARLDDIRVIGVGAEKDFAAIRAHGGTPVSYGDSLADRLAALAPTGVQAAIDLVGTEEALQTALGQVADRSRIATLVAFARAREVGTQALGGAPGQDDLGLAIRETARMRLIALAQAGAFTVSVARTLPLSEAARAHQMLDDHQGGRTVLVPDVSSLGRA